MGQLRLGAEREDKRLLPSSKWEMLATKVKALSVSEGSWSQSGNWRLFRIF